MLKKLVIAGLAIAVGLGLVAVAFPTAWDAFCHWCDQQRQNADKSVPLQTRIDVLKKKVKDLEKQDADMYDKVAKEAVEVDNLEARVAADAKVLKEKEAEATALRDGLGDEAITQVKYAKDKDPLSRDDAETRLRGALKYLKGKKPEVASEQKLLEERKAALAALKEELSSLKTRRNEMETELEQMESELRLAQMQEANSKVASGDSGYSKVHSEMEDLKNDIKVLKKRQELAEEFGDGPRRPAPEKKATGKDLLKQADEVLGSGGDKAVADDK